MGKFGRINGRMNFSPNPYSRKTLALIYPFGRMIYKSMYKEMKKRIYVEEFSNLSAHGGKKLAEHIQPQGIQRLKHPPIYPPIGEIDGIGAQDTI